MASAMVGPTLRFMDGFAGFRTTHIAGIPVLWRADRRFKTFRVALYARRTHDERAAARSMLPSLLLQGTERDHNRPALARRMHDLYGAAVHPMSSKVGESHLLCFALDSVSGRCLPDRPDQLGDGLGLLADLLARPRLDGDGFPSDVFDLERAQTLNMIRTLADDKGSYAMERAIACACEGEPMAIPEHGGLEAVEKLGRADPEVARRDFLTHGAMWAVAMGDLPDESELEAKISAFLAELPERDEQPVAPAVVVPERDATRTRETTDLRQSKLVMVFRAPKQTDGQERVGRNLFVSMFGGGAHSRLFQEVREKRSLAYYASAGLDRHKDFVLVQVGLDRDSIEAAETEILNQLAALQRGEFEDRELDTARSMMLSSLRTVDDSIGQRVRFTTEQWMQQNDRSPEDVSRLCAAATKDHAVAGGAGIWLDHSYVLTTARETAHGETAHGEGS